jgi:hypothetical protein
LSEIIDCLFLVIVWIGFEGYLDILFDNCMFEKYSISSLLAKFFISHAIYLLIFGVQSRINKHFNNHSLIYRIVAEDIINIIMFFSCILVWKFYWNIGELILIDLNKNNKLFYLIFGHFISFVISVCVSLTGMLTGPGITSFDGDSSLDQTYSYYQLEYFV